MKANAMRNDSPVDMSPEAVDLRIRDISDLWDFWMRLELDRRDGKLSGREVPRAVLLTVLEADLEPPNP